MATRTKSTSEGLFLDLSERQGLVDTAQAAVEARRSDLAQAEKIREVSDEILSELVGKLRAGDQSPTALDLATANAAVERAGHLIVGAERAITQQERALPFVPVAAISLASVLKGIVKTDVRVVTRPPTADDVADVELPVLWLHQRQNGKRNRTDGYVEGKVDGYWLHGEFHKDLSVSVLDEGLRARQVGGLVSGDGRSKLGDVLVGRTHYDIARIYEASPVVEGEIQQYKVTRFVSGLATLVQHRTLAQGKEREVVEGKLVSFESVYEGDDRSTEVLVDLEWSHGYFRPQDIVTFAKQVVEGHVGRFVPGVGRVDQAELVNTAHDGARVKLVLLSRAAR